MDDAKLMMVLASAVGASGGVYVSTLIDFVNNVLVFMAIFAILGVAVANVVLLGLFEVYWWLKRD